MQPYITMEVYGRLKAAFREYWQRLRAHQSISAVEQAIIFHAGWLGHYVADGSQPLHTTIHYNGRVGQNSNGYTTEHGIHALFESTYVGANITAKDFASLVTSPSRLTDPFADYLAYLKHSNDLVERVYALDKAGGFTGRHACRFRIHHPASCRRIADAARPLVYGMAGQRSSRTRTWARSWANQIGVAKFHVADGRHRLSAERSSTVLLPHSASPSTTLRDLFRYTD